MQRWKMTAGLLGLAAGAIAIAPRLTAALTAPTTAALPPPPPVVVPVPPAVPTGALVVQGALDQSAALSHRASERFYTVEVSAPAGTGFEERRPVDLSVVVDASGSMRHGKLEEAKRATRHLAASLQPDDTFSLVVFANRAKVVQASGPPDLAALDRALDRVWDYGSTDLYQGMAMGADQVARREGAISRMVVLSDGQPTTGHKTTPPFQQLASRIAASGVSVSTVGLGLDFNEDLLSTISDIGGGDYAFVNEAADLQAVFAGELDRTAAVVARDTRVTIQLPAGLQPVDVIGWDATPQADGWSVYLGDVMAGQTRRIVTRVRVTDQAQVGSHDLMATADYIDLALQDRARTQQATELIVTDDVARVADSLDSTRQAAARRAYGNWYVEMSTRSYAEGDAAQARPLLQRGQDLLEQAAPHAPEALEDLQTVQTTRQALDTLAPSAPAARALIKGNKERYRAVTR